MIEGGGQPGDLLAMIFGRSAALLEGAPFVERLPHCGQLPDLNRGVRRVLLVHVDVEVRATKLITKHVRLQAEPGKK